MYYSILLDNYEKCISVSRSLGTEKCTKGVKSSPPTQPKPYFFVDVVFADENRGITHGDKRVAKSLAQIQETILDVNKNKEKQRKTRQRTHTH